MYRLVILLILSVGTVQAQHLSFYREALNFSLDTEKFTVSGMYFLRNYADSDRETRLFYPYIYETDFIDTLSIYNCNSGVFEEAQKGKKGHWLPVKVPASDSVVLHIKYSHSLPKDSVTYILLSTKAWGKPFEQADYVLRVDKGIEVQKLFLPPDTVYVDSNYHYYQWQRKNFMPASDFTVYYKK